MFQVLPVVMSATVSLKRNWMTTSMYSEIQLLYWPTHLCVWTFPNDIWAHSGKCSFQQDTVWSKVMVVQVSIWTLSWQVSGGIDGLDALSWELALLHSEKQLCPWSAVEGTGIKGKEATLYYFPDIFQSTSHPPCAYHYVLCQKTCCAWWGKGEKPHCSVHIFYMSPTKVFLGFVFLVLNSPLKKASN